MMHWDDYTSNLGRHLPCRRCGVIRKDVGYLTIPEQDGVRRRVIALCTPCAEDAGLEDVTDRTAVLALPSADEDVLELTDSDLIQLLEEPET